MAAAAAPAAVAAWGLAEIAEAAWRWDSPAAAGMLAGDLQVCHTNPYESEVS